MIWFATLSPPLHSNTPARESESASLTEVRSFKIQNVAGCCIVALCKFRMGTEEASEKTGKPWDNNISRPFGGPLRLQTSSTTKWESATQRYTVWEVETKIGI